jgi:hypothetical protein
MERVNRLSNGRVLISITAQRRFLPENATKTVWSQQLPTLSKEKSVSVLTKNAGKDSCLIKETRRKFRTESVMVGTMT